MKAFADCWKRCLRSICCCKFRSHPWFATSQSKTKSYPLHRSWRQTMRLVLLCGQCTRWQTAGRPGRFSNTGHRDKSFGLAKISWTCVPTAWPRSVRRVRLQLVGDQFIKFVYSLPEIVSWFQSNRVFVQHHLCRPVA